MTAPNLRGFALVLIVGAVFFLVACGSSSHTTICPPLNGCCPGSTDACRSPQYVYADGLNGQVSGFPVNSGGGLESPISVSGPQTSLGMAALNNSFLYASHLLSMSTGLVDGWSINIADGSLTSIPGSPFSVGPFSVAGGLAVNNVAQVLYVADAQKIDALKADATGALTPIAGSPFPAGSNIYLATDPSSSFLFAADDTGTGNVLAYTMDSTGALNAAPGSPFALIPNSAALTNPTQIVTDSTGSFVYVGLSGTNQVAAFSIVRPTGGLNVVPGSPFSTGNYPFMLAATNKFLYVNNAMDGTLSGFSIDSTTGILTPLAGSPFAIHAGAMTADPTGQFLYISGPAGMMAFTINSTTGALTEIGTPITSAGATVLTYVQ